MYKNVNDINLSILSLFTQGYDKEFYVREVEKLIDVSPRTSLIHLNQLEDLGILKSYKKGKIKLYKLRNSYLSKEFLLLTEQYKKIEFIRKHLLMQEIMEKIEPFIDGLSLIFGSYAKGLERKDSDLDLFIVGKFDEVKIVEIGERYNLVINIQSYPKKIFARGIGKDILIKEIFKNHILISGLNYFIDEVFKWVK